MAIKKPLAKKQVEVVDGVKEVVNEGVEEVATEVAEESAEVKAEEVAGEMEYFAVVNPFDLVYTLTAGKAYDNLSFDDVQRMVFSLAGKVKEIKIKVKGARKND